MLLVVTSSNFFFFFFFFFEVLWEWTHRCWSLTDTDFHWFLSSIVWQFWLVEVHFPVPFSPLLFCWWAELADRSSGTAMGSSVSSDVSLAGGLSLTVDTHQQKRPSVPGAAPPPSPHLGPSHSFSTEKQKRLLARPCCSKPLHSISFNQGGRESFTWHLGHFLGLLGLHAVQVF